MRVKNCYHLGASLAKLLFSEGHLLRHVASKNRHFSFKKYKRAMKSSVISITNLNTNSIIHFVVHVKGLF